MSSLSKVFDWSLSLDEREDEEDEIETEKYLEQFDAKTIIDEYWEVKAAQIEQITSKKIN
jgi:hypothetical protein